MGRTSAVTHHVSVCDIFLSLGWQLLCAFVIWHEHDDDRDHNLQADIFQGYLSSELTYYMYMNHLVSFDTACGLERHYQSDGTFPLDDMINTIPTPAHVGRASDILNGSKATVHQPSVSIRSMLL